MRIISGKARGTKLYTLEGITTRPTLDRVKESLFNIIQNKIPESIFVDLFAGSGAIGLEAASRGAKEVILCDNNKEAINIIQKNIQKTHLEKEAKVYQMDYEKLLETKLDKKIDIIYIDPPYKSNYAIRAIKILLESKNFTKDGLIIIETDRKEEIEKSLEKLPIKIIDQRKYGRAEIIFIQKGENQE